MTRGVGGDGWLWYMANFRWKSTVMAIAVGLTMGLSARDYPRLYAAFLIACLVILAAMLATRRVIVAWLVYFDLRRDPKYRRPSWRRWLYLRTLAAANGHLARDGRRVRRSSQRRADGEP